MTTLSALSNEVIITIGEFCQVPDLARFARTQRRFIDLFSASIYERNLHGEPYRESCLLYAAAHKRMDILKIALINGADMNGRPLPPSVDPSTRSRRIGGFPPKFMKYNLEYVAPRPLHLAVGNGDQEMVRFLVDNGAAHDVSWLECEDDYKPKEQRLPSFLDETRLAKNPLPPFGIHPDITLDMMMREVNCVAPTHHTHRNVPCMSSIQHMIAPRRLRDAYPLMFALSLPQSYDIASLLVQRGARLASSRDYKALFHSVLVGNIRLFDELLQFYPPTETGEGSIRRRALNMLGDEARNIPIDMMRHAFVKLWTPDMMSEHQENHLFGVRKAGLIFFSLVTCRFREALQILEQPHGTSVGDFKDEFALHFLFHVWWVDVEEIDGPLAPRMPDSNPLATKVKLTKALLDRGAIISDWLQASQSSGLCITPLYLAAIDSAGCPHRLDALELMLEAGAPLNCISSSSQKQVSSLLQKFLYEAAKERDLAKYEPNIILCLSYRVRLHDIGYEHHSQCSGSLEFSILAWEEADGRHPLFELLLKHTPRCNVNTKYIRFLLGKHFVRTKPRVRDALRKLAEAVLGANGAAVGAPPAPGMLH